MKLRIAILGYGAVASVNERQLHANRDVVLSAVYGPDRDKAATFAVEHGIVRSTNCLETATSSADAVVICSPSELHYEQARHCVESGVHTLVELPPCGSRTEAQHL